jgi:hypothetical protein
MSRRDSCPLTASRGFEASVQACRPGETERDPANAGTGWLGAADLIWQQQLDDRAMAFGFREHQR